MLYVLPGNIQKIDRQPTNIPQSQPRKVRVSKTKNLFFGYCTFTGCTYRLMTDGKKFCSVLCEKKNEKLLQKKSIGYARTRLENVGVELANNQSGYLYFEHAGLQFELDYTKKKWQLSNLQWSKIERQIEHMLPLANDKKDRLNKQFIDHKNV
eukprot:UN24958